MKKSIFLIFIMCIIFSSSSVFAKSGYYKNQNGVELNHDEYEFFSEFYSENYINHLTMETYNEFYDLNLIDKKIETETRVDNIIADNIVTPYSSLHETNSKLIKLSKVCSSICKVSILVQWKKSPNIRSYDLVGIYLENTSFDNVSYAHLYNDGNLVESKETRKESNGISTTFKLPTSGNKIEIVQTINVLKQGKLYASYQHAKSNITLANSRKFEFSKYGYGSVFKFDTAVRSYYDAMQGVNFELN